jgi:pre-mRNA-splicing factor CDC5/CEF1
MESAEKGNKLEKKLKLHLGGYNQRAEMLRKKMREAHEALEKARNALGGFKILQTSESAAIQRRLASLRAEVGFMSMREREAQDLYKRTKEELDGLIVNGAGAGVIANGYHH